MTDISSSDNFIDPRDVAEEADNYETDIEEKKEEITLKYQEIENAKEIEDDEAEADARGELDTLDQELAELETEGASIIELNEECENYARGSSLINEDYFPDYIEELAKDCGDITEDSWLYMYIDWDRAAKDCKVDYVTITFEGTDFLAHA